METPVGDEVILCAAEVRPGAQFVRAVSAVRTFRTSLSLTAGAFPK